MYRALCASALLLALIAGAAHAATDAAKEPAMPVKRIPVIAGAARRLCTLPDLGDLKGPKEQIVDHGIIQAKDGSWTLWACMRGTGVSRLLYGWTGKNLDDTPWQPVGVVARADPDFGEPVHEKDGQRVETIGAPFFIKDGNRWLCFYHAGSIRLMTSDDGIHFTRITRDGKKDNTLFPNGGRDAMALKIDGTWYVYSTHTVTRDDEWVALHTSPDLVHWSDEIKVQQGGSAGTKAVTHESPFVVHLDGYYYLFRASSLTFKTYVYRSTDPKDFGLNDDRCLITELPLKAPEILHHDGQWYITDLADFHGITIMPLRWDEAK